MRFINWWWCDGVKWPFEDGFNASMVRIFIYSGCFRAELFIFCLGIIFYILVWSFFKKILFFQVLKSTVFAFERTGVYKKHTTQIVLHNLLELFYVHFGFVLTPFAPPSLHFNKSPSISPPYSHQFQLTFHQYSLRLPTIKILRYHSTPVTISCIKKNPKFT